MNINLESKNKLKNMSSENKDLNGIMTTNYNFEDVWAPVWTKVAQKENVNQNPEDTTDASTYLGILSDLQIKNAMKNGAIVISPYNEGQLNNTSYDVCLGGEGFYRRSRKSMEKSYDNMTDDDVRSLWNDKYSKEKKNDSVEMLNPWDTESLRKYWGEVQTPVEVDNGSGVKQKIIMLRPRETILCHTEEFIGGCIRLTTKLQAKSSMTRCCLSISGSGGVGDIGYVNRWMMVIQNTSDELVPLIVGKPVAQILFKMAGPTLNSYHIKGKYQDSDDFQSIKTNWKIENILPKAKK